MQHKTELWITPTVTAEGQKKCFGSYTTQSSVSIRITGLMGIRIDIVVSVPPEKYENSGTRVYEERKKLLYVTPEMDRRKELKDEYPQGMYLCAERISANLRIGKFVKDMVKHEEASQSAQYPWTWNYSASKSHLPEMGFHNIPNPQKKAKTKKQTPLTPHCGEIAVLPMFRTPSKRCYVDFDDYLKCERQYTTVALPEPVDGHVHRNPSSGVCHVFPDSTHDCDNITADERKTRPKKKRNRFAPVSACQTQAELEAYYRNKAARAVDKTPQLSNEGLELVRRRNTFGLKQCLCTTYEEEFEIDLEMEFSKIEPDWIKSVSRARRARTDSSVYGKGIMDEVITNLN